MFKNTGSRNERVWSEEEEKQAVLKALVHRLFFMKVLTVPLGDSLSYFLR